MLSKELRGLVTDSGSSLMDLPGVGPDEPLQRTLRGRFALAALATWCSTRWEVLALSHLAGGESLLPVVVSVALVLLRTCPPGGRVGGRPSAACARGSAPPAPIAGAPIRCTLTRA